MKHIISLGAGVQSSTMALMAAHGEIEPMPDAAIFADTGAEPKKIYEWLDWLEKQLPFPVYRVRNGLLEEKQLSVRRSKKSDKLYLDSSIPAFVLKDDGKKGILGRRCTEDHKIIPIQRKIRELTGIKRAGKGIVVATVWIGISTDEAHRMKPSQKDYINNIWPLIDKMMNRADCLGWMARKGYPEPPRSACYFCPFHSDHEWLKMKQTDPDEFARAVEFEKNLKLAASSQEVLTGTPFLHRDCQPLDEIELKDNVKWAEAQMDMFGNECEGMCGL